MKSNVGFQGAVLRGKHCYLFISSIRRWISASLSSSASAISEMFFLIVFVYTHIFRLRSILLQKIFQDSFLDTFSDRLSPSSESRIQKLSGLPFFCSSVRKFPSQILIGQKQRGALTAETAGDPGSSDALDPGSCIRNSSGFFLFYEIRNCRGYC